MKIVLAALIISMLAAAPFIVAVRANPFSYPQSMPEVVIASDGSVSPPTGSINRAGATYYLRDDVSASYCLKILCSNIVLDGAGHRFVGGHFEKPTGIYVSGVKNVTVKNIQVSDFFNGVFLSYSNDCIVENVAVSSCYQGIEIDNSNFNQVINNTVNNFHGNYYSDYNGVGLANSNSNILTENVLLYNQFAVYLMNSRGNTVTKNTVANSTCAVNLLYAEQTPGNTQAGGPTPIDNTFYLNNFINNTIQFDATDLGLEHLIVLQPKNVRSPAGFLNYWSYNGQGNYWSDYKTKYPNAALNSSSGTGNIAYVIASNNTDFYPLMKQVVIYAAEPTPASTPTVPEFSWLAILPLLLSVLLVALTMWRRGVSKQQKNAA